MVEYEGSESSFLKQDILNLTFIWKYKMICPCSNYDLLMLFHLKDRMTQCCKKMKEKSISDFSVSLNCNTCCNDI